MSSSIARMFWRRRWGRKGAKREFGRAKLEGNGDADGDVGGRGAGDILVHHTPPAPHDDTAADRDSEYNVVTS
jgi:hypothetical protein